MATEFILFTPVNGGVGATLSCSGSSNRVELPNPTLGSVWAINNTGLEYAFLSFGVDEDDTEASLACMAVAPGITYAGIPNAGSTSAPRWVAGITAGDSVTVQVSAGNVEPG